MPRDIVVIFSGRDFRAVGGMAYKDMRCNAGDNYGFIAGERDNRRIIAHEIGHILGAGHVNDNSIMSENSDGDYFSSTSINEIKSLMVNLNCIHTFSKPNITLTGSRQVAPGSTQFYYANTVSNEPTATYNWKINGLNHYIGNPRSHAVIYFPNSAGYHAIGCQAEKTVSLDGKTKKLSGLESHMTISVNSSYRFMVVNTSNALTISLIENDQDFRVVQNNTNISYQLNNLLTGLLVGNGRVRFILNQTISK